MRLRLLGFMLLMLMAGVGSGCAGYDIRKGGDGAGYDVYRPEPYVLVKLGASASADKEGGVVESIQVVYLPNYAERYRIKSWNVLAKADFDLKIKDGWMLDQVTDKSDNTTLASGLIDLAKESLKGVRAAKSGEKPWALYKITFDDKGKVNGMKLVDISGGTDAAPSAPDAKGW